MIRAGLDGVTREAACSGFERFVEDALGYTEREFSVAQALQSDATGAGGKVVDKLLSDSEAVRERVVSPELSAYREQILAQFDVLLDAIESDGPFETHREEILETDAYDANLRPDLPAGRRSALRDRLFERQQGLAGAVEPLVEAPENEFWAAAASAFDREAMTSLVEDHFAFTDPMQDHRQAERRVIRETKEEIAQRY
ncbi:hypothetical protein BRD07_00450 [Halobacteriales archaeon QS_9_68_42]|nr:MAG: hypothetical protein BRD07_00450 [Halobacteriales archaeon QS_9_68_42]